MNIEWNEQAKQHFEAVITNLPQFHRSIAELLVKDKSQELAQKRQSTVVEDQDVVKAFFQEVPPAFKDMMKRLFSQLGIDYKQYIKE
jgi:ribosomal protein L17